jgi:hypothetical protein
VTDELRIRFADLRARTLPEVQLPGEGAVRRTTRRRRAIRSGAALVAVVALAGGLFWRIHGSDDGLAPAQRETLAAEAVGIDPARRDDLYPLRGYGLVVPGYATPFFVNAGEYTVTTSCVGPGKVTIEFTVGSPGIGELRSTLMR